MDLFTDSYFSSVRTMLSLVGLWPTQTYKERIFRYSITCSMSLYSLLLQVCYFILTDTDLWTLVFQLEVFIGTSCLVIMYYTAIRHFRKIQKLVNHMREDLLQLKDGVELKIMQKHTRNAKLFSVINAFQVVCIVSFLILPVILRKNLCTYEGTNSTGEISMTSCTDYFIDREKYYYPLLIYHIAVCAVTCTAGFTCFSLYFWCIQHVCAYLSIIKNEINRPFRNNQFKIKIIVKQVDQVHWIIGIIERFSRTKQFMKVLNTLSDINYLVQVSLACLLLAIHFLFIPAMLEKTGSQSTVCMFLMFALGSFFLTFGNCHIGQQLIDYGADVYTEVCLVPLHEISVKTQKLLLTTLMMNAKLSVISIGKMFVVSHEFFSDLVRISLSFAMVMRSIQK